jgi:hypothetical protein
VPGRCYWKTLSGGSAVPLIFNSISGNTNPFDPAHTVTPGADFDGTLAIAGYAQTFSLFDRSAMAAILLPMGRVSGDVAVAGATAKQSASGFGDPMIEFNSSVIASYTIGATASVRGEYAPPGRGDTLGAIGIGANVEERPTITFSPLAGEKFARSLMTPLPVSGILYLLQAGFPAENVLRACAISVNGLENAYGGRENARAGDPRFAELLRALRAAQRAGVMMCARSRRRSATQPSWRSIRRARRRSRRVFANCSVSHPAPRSWRSSMVRSLPRRANSPS